MKRRMSSEARSASRSVTPPRGGSGSCSRSRSGSRTRESPSRRERSRSQSRNRRTSDGDEVEIKLLVSSKGAGAVIGRGGESIKALRADNSCTVHIPDSTTPERILIVAGRESDVMRVVRDVSRKLDDDRSRDREDRPSRPGDTEIRILVHSSHAGAVIGRGGSEIKRLREETKSTIKVFSDCCPRSTERVISLVGDIDDVLVAIRKVLDVCIETEIKGPASAYDTRNYNDNAIRAYGGYAAPGGGGGRDGRSGGPFNSRPVFGGGRDRGRDREDRSSRSGRSDRGNDRYDRGRSPLDRFDRDRGRGGDRYGGGASSSYSGGSRRDGPSESTQVTIPDDLAGTVIGKGGQRINSIRQDSGAEISIGQPTPGGNRDRIITINGSASQIQRAQYMLQQCVRDSPAGQRYIAQQQSR